MTNEYPYEAKRHIEALVDTLQALIARDPEQEVQSIALVPLGACIEYARVNLPNNPVASVIAELFSADFIAAGEPLRAADALVVASQLNAAIGPYPPVVA